MTINVGVMPKIFGGDPTDQREGLLGCIRPRPHVAMVGERNAVPRPLTARQAPRLAIDPGLGTNPPNKKLEKRYAITESAEIGKGRNPLGRQIALDEVAICKDDFRGVWVTVQMPSGGRRAPFSRTNLADRLKMPLPLNSYRSSSRSL